MFNSKQFDIAETKLEDAIDEAIELEKKNAPKKKAKKAKGDKKKGPEPEEEGPPPIPGETPYNQQLRELVRTERFESRLQHMHELNNIKRSLDSDPRAPNIPSYVLEKAMFFPEDEKMPKEFYADKRYPGIGESLFNNPFPAVKKGKKGKKKKK